MATRDRDVKRRAAQKAAKEAKPKPAQPRFPSMESAELQAVETAAVQLEEATEAMAEAKADADHAEAKLLTLLREYRIPAYRRGSLLVTTRAGKMRAKVERVAVDGPA